MIGGWEREVGERRVWKREGDGEWFMM